eukprot:PhM_4_TR2065/c0_g1_i1/m.99845
MPMGQRHACDVASTATDMLLSFTRPSTVKTTAYIDNVRFVSDDKDALIAAANEFVRRCRRVHATINEVDASCDATSRLQELMAPDGEFLGIDHDYLRKRVRLGSKALEKLRLLAEHAQNPAAKFTHQNFLALFGVLFFELQVARRLLLLRPQAVLRDGPPTRATSCS